MEKSIAARTVALSLTKLIVVLLAWQYNRGSTRIIGIISAIELAFQATIISRCIITATAAERPTGGHQSDSYRAIGRSIRTAAANSWLASVSKSFHRDLDIIATFYLLDPSSAGLLRLVKSITSTGLRLTDSVYNVLLAKHATKPTGSLRDAADIAVRNAQAMFPWLVIAAAICSVATALCLQLLLEYRVPTTLPTLLLYSLGTAAACATVSWQPIQLTWYGPSHASRAALIGVTTQAAIILILTPWMGPAACGLAYLAFYLAWASTTYRTLKPPEAP